MLSKGVSVNIRPAVPVDIVLAGVKIRRDLLLHTHPAAKGQGGLVRISYSHGLQKRRGIYTPERVKKIGHARRNAYDCVIQIAVPCKGGSLQSCRS